MKIGNIDCENGQGITNLMTAVDTREELKKDIIVNVSDSVEFKPELTINNDEIKFQLGEGLNTTTFTPSSLWYKQFGQWADITGKYMDKMVEKSFNLKSELSSVKDRLNEIEKIDPVYRTSEAERESEELINQAVVLNDRSKGLNSILYNQIEYFFKYPKNNPRRLFRLMNPIGDQESGIVRSFHSNSYKILDDNKAIQSVLRATGEELQDSSLTLESAHLGDTKMFLKFVNKNIGAVINGKEVNYMLTVRNSEVGTQSFNTAEGYYVQWCSNGAIRETILKQTHRGVAKDTSYKMDTLQAEGELSWRMLRDDLSVSMTQEHMDEMVRQIEGTVGVTFTKPEEVIKDVTKKFRLSDDESLKTLVNIQADSSDFGMSQWALSNAITKTAQKVNSYARSTELESIGSDILKMPSNYFDKKQYQSQAVTVGNDSVNISELFRGDTND